MQNINITKNGTLSIEYSYPDFPVSISTGSFLDYPNRSMPAHWRSNIEFIMIKEGSMISHLYGYEICLHEGNIIFINSKQLHKNYTNDYDCSFLLVQINPQFLSPDIKKGSQADQLLKDIRFRCFVFRKDNPQTKSICTYLSAIEQIQKSHNELKQLEIAKKAFGLYRCLCEFYNPKNEVDYNLQDTDQDIQRSMITYIYEHFAEKLTLEDIAFSGNISRSKCCKLFAQYLKQSPIDFLNDFRLEVACKYLIRTNAQLSKIAQVCGFTDQAISLVFSKTNIIAHQKNIGIIS